MKLLTDSGIECHRNQQMYIGGADNPDISAVIGGKGYHLEVKRVERLNLHAAMRQAERDTQGGSRIPAVCHRTNREPWLVTIKLSDFLRGASHGNE